MSTYTPQQSKSTRSDTFHAATSACAESNPGGHPLLGLQRSAGNQAVMRMLAGSRAPSQPIRAKLTVNAPDDAFEQEAERMADHVTGAAASTDAPPIGHSAAPRVSRDAAGPANVPTVTHAQDAAVTALRGGGAPMAPSARASFEPHFGRDFADVRLHTDDRAAALAESLDARAFTVGSDIVFGAGMYSPESAGGRRLLAHELTHVAQNGAAGENGRVQRDPTPAPKQSEADQKKEAEKKRKEEEEAKAIAKKVANERPVVDFIYSVYKDLRYGADFSPDERKKFQLKGTESASYGALASAGALAATGSGGLRFGFDASTSFSTLGKYFDATSALTPSTTTKTDLVSRIVGMRVDEYLGSDTFMRRLKENPQTLALIISLAQLGISAKTVMGPDLSTPSPDIGGFVDEKWKSHLSLVTGVLGLVLKDKLTAPGMFDIGPLLTPTHPLYANDTYFGGNLPSGLNVDAAKGLGTPGDFLHLGATWNIGKTFAPIGNSKVDAASMDDPTKYSGWQGAVWGDYSHLLPTPTLSAAGRVPDARYRAGAIFGNGGLFVLGEVGGHFSGPEAKKLTSTFFTEGVGYAPPGGGHVKKIGFKVTHIDVKKDDSLAPKDANGATADTSATRLSPFGSFSTNIGGGTLDFGGSAGLTFMDGQKPRFTDWRGDVSFTYVGTNGTTDMPVLRIEVAASGSDVDYFNPASKTLYGGRAKVQTGSFFTGAQFNFGADKIAPDRAAQMGDPRTEAPSIVTPGGNSVLFVVGVLK